MPRRVPLAANPLLRIKLSAGRSKAVMGVLALAFTALAFRAFQLQVLSNDFLQKQGEMRYERSYDIPASRGKIFDRNGVVLASSLPARAIWANPVEVDELTRSRLKELSSLLGLPVQELQHKLQHLDNDPRTFVYLKRQVDADIADKVAALKLAGIYQIGEFKRYYPEGETLANVVGFTNVEDVGQEGMELSQQKRLAGSAGHRRLIRDRLGQPVEDVQAVREPHDGDDLVLSLDSKVQFLAFSAIRDAMREHHAKAAAAIVLDVKTGEVLALANLPSYDPNQRDQMNLAQVRNRALTDTFEPGSTMKPFTAAMALESERFTPTTVIQTALGKLTIGPATISDAHPHGALTVEQVIQKSSNVGTAKMALTLAPKTMWEMYSALGFGQAPQTGFPGAVAGRMRPYRTWKPIEQATMSYGHGIAVSLMQLARAYTALARDGDVVPVTIMRAAPNAAVTGIPVMKPETARAVRHMLEMAVGPEGTAPKAQIVGYRVAGKTGTAYKLENGRYVQKYVSSFVGFAPASDPRIVVAVMLDEPSNGKHYGGDVAAPVFSRIAGESLRALRVAPDAPIANLVIPDEPVRESL
jgi:cell division protein FtsI (penicillin-binding protein 3)